MTLHRETPLAIPGARVLCPMFMTAKHAKDYVGEPCSVCFGTGIIRDLTVPVEAPAPSEPRRSEPTTRYRGGSRSHRTTLR